MVIEELAREFHLIDADFQSYIYVIVCPETPAFIDCGVEETEFIDWLS